MQAISSRIKFTNNAITRLMQLKSIHGPSKHLIVTVSSGGCSGFQYNFDIIKNVPKDYIPLLERDDCTRVYTDIHTMEIIKGCQIHYQEKLIACKFILQEIKDLVRNCSCGNSFDIKT
ncbi:bifunctional HesB-like domain superfamily/FeS cluster biogenesis/FeS cluster insertion protein [Babesia duncani]|uniref:Bifunctional HesB-like domain superfamily/FeS cluster biogenesis/FeS cluster insertion protein n=1 Tax=Babesia duncani TaxID=323732 RepID=A0AAD9PHD0_9APIC|nr:bifunctional HesB-like domain superfamily/FeS cluster biogenesis/FeS cluster insertion protein [Babesia duncani]KAK2196539.1 bifunctional HesB-like domain superfamily/FeS cluster biogenesis/FeS cluster insertion protein [Babesia duncani]